MTVKLRMTKDGVETQKQKLIELEYEVRQLDKAMTMACHNSSGDGPHDNAEFEDLLRQARMKAKEIQNLQQLLQNIEIIEVKDMGEEYVNIDDIIDANFIFAPDDEEEMTIQLVGGNGNSSKNQFSINSPVGKAIYGKKIGETVFYEANNNKIAVNLIRKVKVKKR